MMGSTRPSRFGSHQLWSPSSPMGDGTSIIRTMVAASKTASGSVTPSSVGGIGPVTPNATNTTINYERRVGSGAAGARDTNSRIASLVSPFAS